MRVEESLGLVGVRCADLCGPPLKRLNEFDKVFSQKCYALYIPANKKMASVGDKSSPAEEEKRNLVMCFCASLEVSPVNIKVDQVVFVTIWLFYVFLLASTSGLVEVFLETL